MYDKWDSSQIASFHSQFFLLLYFHLLFLQLGFLKR